MTVAELIEKLQAEGGDPGTIGQLRSFSPELRAVTLPSEPRPGVITATLRLGDWNPWRDQPAY